MSFANSDSTFFGEAAGVPAKVVAAADGSTVALTSSDTRLYIDNAAALASLTVKLPAVSYRGQTVELVSRSGVTALTVQAPFGSVVSAPTSLSANIATIFKALVPAGSRLPVWACWNAGSGGSGGGAAAPAGIVLLAKWTAFDCKSAGDVLPSALNIPAGRRALWTHLVLANPSTTSFDGNAYVYLKITGGPSILNNGATIQFARTTAVNFEVNNGNFKDTLDNTLVINLAGQPSAVAGTVDVLLLGALL